MRELCAELITQVLERTPHCLDSACQITFRVRQGWVILEHLDATQDHPFGAHRVLSIETLNTYRGDLIGQLVRWLERTHPLPNVRLVA